MIYQINNTKKFLYFFYNKLFLLFAIARNHRPKISKKKAIREKIKITQKNKFNNNIINIDNYFIF
jgi:hypothetical protein